MPAFSFQPRFVRPILVGLGKHHELLIPDQLRPTLHPKRQTIRALRKDGRAHAHEGDILSLYCQQRSPHGFLIGQGRCTRVCRIALAFNDEDPDEAGVISPGFGIYEWGFDSLDAFARGDGFDDWKELREFWRTTHPGAEMFEGCIIFWEPLDESTYRN